MTILCRKLSGRDSFHVYAKRSTYFQALVSVAAKSVDSLRQAQPICDNQVVCNRYRLTHSKHYLAERFQATADEVEEHPRYNIAPTQPVLIVRKEHGKKIRHFTTMRWGLIPSWAKDMSIGNRTLNARSETVTTTPAFRDSILTKRCLVPADGFYEWPLSFMMNSFHYSASRTIAE
ncbi:MAG TPA: SOS response-associated peptidase [Candidatus Binatia bacterium]|nr:SOS response-associated peptidase [Candidatus Binatia bacterium]